MIPEFETHPEIVSQTLTTLHVLVVRRLGRRRRWRDAASQRLNPRNILAVADVDIAPEEFLKCLEMPSGTKIDVVNLVGALCDVEKTRTELVSRGGASRRRTSVVARFNPRSAIRAQ